MKFSLIKKMHRKFGLSNEANVTRLSKEEYLFRIGAMYEELMEYVTNVFETDISPDRAAAKFKREISQFHLNPEYNLEDEMDALLDLIVFAAGTGERQGFNMPKGFERVMEANISKELAIAANNSKRGFSRDLVKPEGWKAPDFSDLMGEKKITGLILLEGPDGSGKTTLANHFIEKHGAEYFHCTWSPQLENDMYNYITMTLEAAISASKGNLVVLDRNWISEFVYADVYRGGSKWKGMHERLMRVLNYNKVVTVICYPEIQANYTEHFKQLIETRDEMYNDTSKVYEMYKALWEGSECDHYVSKGICETIMELGGFKKMPGFVRYDFTDSRTLDHTCAELINTLKIGTGQ